MGKSAASSSPWRVSLMLILFGALLIASPLLLGPAMGRFFVVGGFLAACGGMGIGLNAFLEKRRW